MRHLPRYQHAPPTRLVHSLQFSLTYPVTQSPWCTLGFTLGVTHSTALDKYIMTCIYHDSGIQSIFSTLKILYVPPVFTPSTPGSHWSFYSLHSLAWDSFLTSEKFRLRSREIKGLTPGHAEIPSGQPPSSDSCHWLLWLWWLFLCVRM